jgi:hypothetical protein
MTNNSEFNGNDAAATVAAAEHHMQQQQIMANIIQQQHNMPFLFNNNIIQNNIIDPKQFDEMSREELISRLITLEKEKIIENKTDIISEEDNILMLEQQQQIQVENVRTCLWANCGEKFTILQDLISHITEVHVGGGKVTINQVKLNSCILTLLHSLPIDVNGRIVLETISHLQKDIKCMPKTR